MLPEFVGMISLSLLAGPAKGRKVILNLPPQAGDNTCWAAVSTAIRRAYSCKRPPPNDECDFISCYWKDVAGKVPVEGWDTGLDSVAPALMYAEVLGSGPYSSAKLSETAVQVQLDAGLVVVPDSAGHVTCVAAWDGNAPHPCYEWHDSEKRSVGLSFKSFSQIFAPGDVFFTRRKP